MKNALHRMMDWLQFKMLPAVKKIYFATMDLWLFIRYRKMFAIHFDWMSYFLL